ncbi:MAG: penicillin-binding protein 2 [Sphingomonadales bacterium]|nr:penicillin-binding protein 2 [Sphingomonadales bacterium]
MTAPRLGPGQGGRRLAGAQQRLELVDLRCQALADAKLRVRWVLRVFAVIALTAIAQIVHLGIADNGARRDPIEDALLPDRADIVDRNNVPLARAFPSYSLWFDPGAMGDGAPLVEGPQATAAALHRIFPDLDEADLARRLASGKPQYLRRRILPEEANRVHALGEPALEFPREVERYYPQGSMGAHILGYVDAEGHGQYGMEQVLDKRLRGDRGTPAVLSIDTRVQGALEDELERGISESDAAGGGGIVLDVDTGEVLALASLPSFDPNVPRVVAANGEKLMRNHITSEIYELGSVLKPITVASAIEAGAVTDLARRYPAGKQRVVGGHLVHDDKDFGATLNVPEALVHSSNIVLSQVGLELGWQRLSATLRALGFDRRPVIELPARGEPHFPAGKWSDVTTTTVAYGHGLAVTPLHIACAYAALVNGGVWHPATLMKLAPGAPVESRRIWKPETSARIRQLLRLITSVGTGRSANAAGFRVGGKTGTAEIGDRGGYHKDKVITTFASAFPMDHPRYIVLATLEQPKATAVTMGQRTAAWNAAPVVGRVIPRIGPLLGVMPDDTRDIDIADVAPLVANGEGE